MNTNTHQSLVPSRIVYLHVGYEGSSCAMAAPTIELNVNFKLDRCSNWRDLFSKIASPISPPAAILIHLNTLRTSPNSVAEITGMINTMLGQVHTTCSVGVVVDNLVDVAFVKELRKSNILNIVPGVEFLGIDESTKATVALLAGIPYIIDVVEPEPVIALPRVVSFRFKKQEQWSKELRQSINENDMFRMEFATDLESLTELISEPTDLILFHSTMLDQRLSAQELVNMIYSLAFFTTGKTLKIGVVIDKNTPLSLVKELRSTDVCGLIPSSGSWSITASQNAVNEILTTGSYWPKDIIASLPGNEVKPHPSKLPFKLTDRQKQIVDLICTRGLSNKRIALTLHIAESTVKIHVSAALKVYGVRTRTQLALAAKPSLVPA